VTKSRTARLALPALIGGAVGIAFAPIFVRLSQVGPTATAFWRLALAIPLLWLWATLRNREKVRPRKPATKSDYALLIAAGLFFAGERHGDEILQLGDLRLIELGYEEAVELAYFGARVIHPAAAKHAVAGDVSLVVRNAERPEQPGTRIRPDTRRASGVAAIAYKPAVTLIRVRSRPMFMAYGFLARVFEVLARHRTPVDLVATSHTSTAFTLDGDESLGAVREDLGKFAEVEVLPHLATVSVVGHGLLQEPGITARVFSALGQTPVHLISQASDVSLSFLVEAIEAHDVVRRLHAELIESRT